MAEAPFREWAAFYGGKGESTSRADSGWEVRTAEAAFGSKTIDRTGFPPTMTRAAQRFVAQRSPGTEHAEPNPRLPLISD
ncbi:MAG: hypothetical protein IID37_03105 [Planctomycetes bacterium]|nr:hypothetical protein [Planctomycetota bacterium]